MTTGALWDERYMWWDTRSAGAFIPAGGWIEPDEHAENPRTKRRLKNLLDASGLSKQLQGLDARPATVEELCRVHDEGYVQRMAEMSAAGGGDAGELVPFGPGGYDIARLAAGGVVVAAEAVHARTVDNAYALVSTAAFVIEPD
jgi:acetoin utilization deacetylase AcuC-like enzyme